MEANPLTDEQRKEFLNTYTGDGCGRRNCRNSPEDTLTRFNNQVAEGCSRHDTMASVLPWALSEAMAGCYAAREAVAELGEAFAAAFTDADDAFRRNNLRTEFMRLVQWAAAHADSDRAHRVAKRRDRFAYPPQLARFARMSWRPAAPPA